MIVKKFFDELASIVPLSNSDSLYSYLNQAAKELWAGADFPNTLQEIFTKPFESGKAFISLPHYVYAVRGVVPCSGMTTDYMSKSAGFMDDFWLNSPWRWRQVSKTPQMHDIEEASQLTIKRKNPKDTSETVIAIGGSSDVAENLSEAVGFTASDIEKTTVNPYSYLGYLGKDSYTTCDFEVYDTAGNLIAMLPNNYDEVYYIKAQVLLREGSISPAGFACCRVLYKPVLPPFVNDTDSIPDGMEQALLFKIREWLDLSTEDKLDRAAVMSEKSTSLFSRAALNLDRGQIKPIPLRRSVYHRWPGFNL